VIRKRTSNQQPKRTARLTPIGVCGALVVTALVLALPLTLVFCPAETLGGTDGASGVGAGTGDEVAAAVSSLSRDLRGANDLPQPTRCSDAPNAGVPGLPPDLAFARGARFGAHPGTTPPRSGSRLATPGDARVGLTDLGHQLLL
jgi:hypothetical protein